MKIYRRDKETQFTRAEISKTGNDRARPFIQTQEETMLSSQGQLEKKIWETNEGLKRINGHSAEYVAEHIGVSVEELFPEHGKSLYVGDPWQKLDKKGVVIVDYEFGPIAEFQDNKERYLALLRGQLSRLENSFHSSQELDIRHFLEREITLVNELYNEMHIQPLTEYERIGKMFLEMKQRVEEEIGRETSGKESDPLFAMNLDVQSLWYAAVHGARCLDLLDWATELEPTFLIYAESLSEQLSQEAREEKLKEKRRELITRIRFEKTTKEAEVVQAMFPFLPFENESFDRFVAFWSISTYAFEHLTPEELTRYWEEIYRILKPGGKAYISPLFEGNEFFMHQTLSKFQIENPDFFFDDEDDNQLRIEKRVR